MKKVILEPRVSLGGIAFGEKIEQYRHREFQEGGVIGDTSFKRFTFSDVAVEAYLDAHNFIESVRCDSHCFWNDVDLIGLKYQDFLRIYPKVPDSEDEIFVTQTDEQPQYVYDFDDLGLQLWVSDESIVTLFAY